MGRGSGISWNRLLRRTLRQLEVVGAVKGILLPRSFRAGVKENRQSLSPLNTKIYIAIPSAVPRGQRDYSDVLKHYTFIHHHPTAFCYFGFQFIIIPAAVTNK